MKTISNYEWLNKPRPNMQKLRGQESRKVKCHYFLLLLIGMHWGISVAIAGISAGTISEVQNKVSVELSCLSGHEVQLTLPLQQAAKLDCRQLGVGLKEIYLWTDSNDTDRAKLIGIWEEGNVFEGDIRFDNRQRTWVPFPLRIILYATLELQDKEIHARIRVETDNNKIIDFLKEKKEEREKTLNSIDYNDRLAGFIHLWAEVKYNFAFFDKVPEVNWDSVLNEYLPKIEKEQTTQEYYKLLQMCFAKLKDGHTDITSPTLDTAIPPIVIRKIGGKAIVTLVEDVNEVVQSGIKPGMEITYVDGRSVSDILQTDIYPYICAGTQQYKELKAYSQLLVGNMLSKVSIRFADMEGGTHEAILTRSYHVYGVPFNQPLLTYKKLENSIVYVALNSFDNEKIIQEFDNIFDGIINSKGLIIDIRENGGGNGANGDAIIGRLTDKPLLCSRWKSPQHVAAFKAWKLQEVYYEGGVDSVPMRGNNPFLGPIVVLIGAGTISAAEDFLIPLHAAGRAILVGEKTAGTTGQPLIVKLPKGGNARICTKHDMYPDGREFVGIGIIPDVEVHPTQKDICDGQDIVFEKAMEVIREQIRQPNDAVGCKNSSATKSLFLYGVYGRNLSREFDINM